MNRNEALALVKKYIKTENTVKHMLATEAIMRSLASKFEPGEEDKWGLVGLIHDLDYEVMEDASEHGVKTIELFKEEGVELDKDVIQSIKAHNYERNGAEAPKTKMDWSLYICDSLTGLITATALVRPQKNLESVKVKSVMKKFKQPSFAAGTRREEISMCEEKLGIELRDFVEISLKAMQGISDDLAL